MGTKMEVSFANIFMAKIETNADTTEQNQGNRMETIYWRYK